MNMNKKLLLIIITFLSFNIFIGDVFAKCSDAVIRTDPLGERLDFAVDKEDIDIDACENVLHEGLNACEVKEEMACGGGDGGACVVQYSCIKSPNKCVGGAFFDRYAGVCECKAGYKEKNGKCVVDNSTGNDQNVDCSTLTSQKNCSANLKCVWDNVNKVCKLDELLAEPCSEKNIKVALRFIGYLLMIAKIAVPLIIIVIGTLDLFKSVVDKDEKSLSKQAKVLGMRIVGGMFIFFLPTVVYALFELSSDLNIVSSDKYNTCVTCVLKPNDCDVSNNNNN